MAFLYFFVFLLFTGSNARCLGERHCRCIASKLACVGVTHVPDFPVEFIKEIEVLDLRRCRFSRLSQLNDLGTWPNLKFVDIRDQWSLFECDSPSNMHFEFKSDCNENETTTNGDYWDITTQLQTTDTSIETTPSALPLSTLAPTTKLPLPTKRRFPLPPRNMTTTRIATKPTVLPTALPTKKPMPTQPVPVTQKATLVAPTVNTPIKDLRAMYIAMAMTIIFAILFLSMVAVLFICFKSACFRCRNCTANIWRSACRTFRDKSDKDSDDGHDNMSASSTVLFDITTIDDTDEITPPAIKLETIRPRFHDKYV